MATRAVNTYVKYHAWNTSTNVPVVGDSGNHTLRWIKDNVSSAPSSGAPSEVDSNNAVGVYMQFVSAGDADCISGKLAGKSSTANVSIFGPSIFFDYLPSSAPGSPGGMMIDGTNVGLVTLQGGLTISGAPVNANVQQINGISNPASGAHVGVDWGQIINQATTVNLTNTTVSSTISGTVPANITQVQGISAVASGGSLGAYIPTPPAVNVTQWLGLAVPTSSISGGGVPIVDTHYLQGFSSPASGGFVGVDWGHVVNATTALDLSNTTIKNLDGNTVQTGDSFARLGAPAGASVSADIAEIEGETDTLIAGVNVTSIANNVITNAAFAAAAITAAVTDSTFDNAIADALLDRTSGIETSMTPRQALRIIGASAAGVLSGATTATININGMGVATQRISASVDQSGNRTSISLTP